MLSGKLVPTLIIFPTPASAASCTNSLTASSCSLVINVSISFFTNMLRWQCVSTNMQTPFRTKVHKMCLVYHDNQSAKIKKRFHSFFLTNQGTVFKFHIETVSNTLNNMRRIYEQE